MMKGIGRGGATSRSWSHIDLSGNYRRSPAHTKGRTADAYYHHRPHRLAYARTSWRASAMKAQPVALRGDKARSIAEDEIQIGARRYVSAQRVTSMLRISIRTLSRWNAAGIGPPKIKIGKRVFFDLGKLSGLASESRNP